MSVPSTDTGKRDPPKKSFWKRHKDKILRAVALPIEIIGWFGAFHYWDMGDNLGLAISIMVIILAEYVREMTY